MAFPQDILDITVEIALGADRTADPATWDWTDITDWCQPQADINDIGRSDEQSSAKPSSLTLSVDNADGRFTRLNPLSPWYGLLDKGTPIRVAASDGIIAPSRRFQGELTELPPRWEQGTTEQWVPITASGVLRRLGQQDITDSAVKRYVLGQDHLHGYWPIEDGRDSGLYAASAVPGQSPLRVETDYGGGDATGAQWAALSDLPGSEPVAAFEPTTHMRGHGLNRSASPGGNNSSSIMWWARGDLVDGATDGVWASARISPTGTDLEYRIAATDAEVVCTITDVNDDSVVATLTSAAELGPLALIGTWHSIALLIEHTPAGPRFALFVDGHSGDLASVFNRDTGHLDKIIIPNRFDGNITRMGVGHLAVFDGIDYRQPADFYAAGMGYTAEPATDRISRLCAEEDIPAAILAGPEIGGTPPATRMGAQTPQSLASLLRQCEAADGGLLYEDPQAGGIGYIARSYLYSITGPDTEPDMTLDIAAGDVTDNFEIDDGDQYTVNDMTVTRSGGSSARVQDVPAGDLPDPRSVTLAVDSDGSLEHQASWRVHLGTGDQYRFPYIELDLAARPERIAAWVACRIGSRIVVENPPPGMSPSPINLIIVGYSEMLDGIAWTVRLHCAPASPYEVARLAGDLTIIREGFETDEPVIDITGGGDGPWFRTDQDAHHGAWSLQSGPIFFSETSEAIVTVPAGCTRVRFWYRASCEPVQDHLRVITGGIIHLEASGQTPWTRSDYIPVTPGDTVTFRYTTSVATTRYDNCARIDDVQFEGGAPAVSGPRDRTRLDTAGSELVDAVGADDTVISVATTRGPVWVTDPGAFPFDLAIGGEIVTVTAITGTSSPQEFTVVRAVNGVHKPHAAGAPVSLAYPMILALGD